MANKTRQERKYNPTNVPLAKALRKNMTEEEKHLWYDFLHKYPIHFKRQKVLGKYIADFYCAKANLIIELDGSQHYTEEGKEYDKERTEYLEKYGIEVLRFTNPDIKTNFEGVCLRIDNVIKKKTGK